MKNKIKSDPYNRFVLIAGFLLIAVFVIENINHRFWLNDFKVFYMAADAMFHDRQVYGIPFGLDTGFYKYSPFTLLLFAPFTLLPFQVAAIIYFFVVAACVISAIILLHRIMVKYIFTDSQVTFLILFLTLLSIINHVVRELHLGNTNMVLVLLLSLSLKFAIEKKSVLAGLLFAIVIFTKPYFMVCLLPLLWYRQYKTIIAAFLSTVVFTLITLLVTGFAKGIFLFRQWIDSMREHSGYLESKHTIFSLLNTYFGIQTDPANGIIYYGIIALLMLFLLVALKNKSTDDRSNTIQLIRYYFLFMALVPSILITDTEHFLFSLPYIVILLQFVARKKNSLAIVLIILLMFLYGGNSSDLLGKKLAEVFEEYGFLGISNLIIIVTTVLLSRSLLSNPPSIEGLNDVKN